MADQRNISWGEVRERAENEVDVLLFPGRGDHQSVFAQSDWGAIHRELARVGVTLKLLHGEYVDALAGSGQAAMGYDRFCKVLSAVCLGIARNIRGAAQGRDEPRSGLVGSHYGTDRSSHSYAE